MPRALAIHALATPFITSLTYAFVTLREDDLKWWKEVLHKDAMRQLGLGLALGSAAYLTTTGVATAFGWVHFPSKGWQALSKQEVLETLVSHLGHLAVSWNEEMLYRGYGLQSLSQAVGKPGAVMILVPLFAWGHAPGLRVLAGQSALGLGLTSLRLASNSLWLPIGYHASWNYIQTAILGPPDASPSLLPMYVQGPDLWIGRPGYPEPGLLSTMINLIVAGGAFWFWWRSRRTALRRAERKE